MSTAAGKGVFTNEYRFAFVKKDAADVGAGTAWPMLVTLDQIAELYYRVRDSVLTGEMMETFTYGFDPPVESTIAFGFSGSPGSDLVESSSPTPEWFYRRAYSTKDATDFEDYFSAAYTVGGTIEPDDYYDAIGEFAMWSFPVGAEFRTGFSQFITGDNGFDPLDPSSDYICYLDIGDRFASQASVVFDGTVAWIDDSGSGNFFDPANRKFIGVRFDVSNGLYPTTLFTTVDGGGYLQGTDFEIELAGDVLACPLYSTSSGPGHSYSGNIRLVATAWWPYAKDSPAVPVWDAGTGARL